MKHFWQFLIIAISWKYVRRRPICFVTAPHVSVFHSPAIFAVLHWSFVFKHQTLLCFCLTLVTISIGRKSKDRSFWLRSLHVVNTSRRCVHNDQWRWYSNYSCTRIPMDNPPTRVCVSGSLLVLLTYEYLGGYELHSTETTTCKNLNILKLCTVHLNSVSSFVNWWANEYKKSFIKKKKASGQNTSYNKSNTTTTKAILTDT